MEWNRTSRLKFKTSPLSVPEQKGNEKKKRTRFNAISWKKGDKSVKRRGIRNDCETIERMCVTIWRQKWGIQSIGMRGYVWGYNNNKTIIRNCSIQIENFFLNSKFLHHESNSSFIYSSNFDFKSFFPQKILIRIVSVA